MLLPLGATKLRLPGGFLQLAIDPQLDATYRKQMQLCFGPAGLDLVADPELLPPDARRRLCHGELNALVDHQRTPRQRSGRSRLN